MTIPIKIIDRGRGPQLSSSRITVQDIVPYIQQNLSHEKILEIMPALTLDELKVIEQYVQDNYQAVMEQDHRIRERNANRKIPPEIDEVLRRGGEKIAALREVFKNGKPQELNGDHVAG
jgi:uncharacterized protein (DUF433 family)